jgi:hypothetical protein
MDALEFGARRAKFSGTRTLHWKHEKPRARRAIGD